MDSNKTMKAVTLESSNEKLIIKEIPLPEPKENQVLVKMIASPINPSDLACINGLKPMSFPTQLGAEGFGTVIKAGDKNGEHLVGKKVSFYTNTPNAWSEYATIGLNELMESTSDASPEVGATTFLNAVTTLGLVENVKKGTHKAVIITTASACSKMLFKLFKEEGIKTIAVVRKDAQKQLCLENGATIALNSTDKDFEEQLKKAATEFNATACIECIVGDILNVIIRNMPQRSEIIIYGKLNDSGPNAIINLFPWLIKETTLRTYVWDFWLFPLTEEKRQAVFERIRKGLNDVFKTDISKNFKLEEINEAHEFYLKNMSQGKVILNIGN